MTLFGRITQGSKTIMLFVQQSRARKRNIAIVAALLGVAVVWGAVWALTEQGLSASERVANSWSSLSRCLVGKPLGKGESPSARFRAVQMTAMTQAAAKRAAAKGKAETWPERCASYGHALAEALKDASRDEGPRQELAQAAAELATQLGEGDAVVTDLTKELEQIFALGATANMERVAVPDVPAPPEPASPLTVDGLNAPPLSDKPFELDSLHADVHPGSTLRLLVDAKGMERSPALCELHSREPTATCKPLPAEVAKATHGGFGLLGTAAKKAAPLVFAGRGGSDGVFRADSGRLVAQAECRGGHVTADGVATVLAWNDVTRRLGLVRDQGKRAVPYPVTVPQSKLELKDPLSNAHLLWGQLVLRGTNRFDELWLFAAEVRPTGPAMGPLVPVGRLPGTEAQQGPEGVRFSGCQSAKATVLRVDDGRVQFLSFLIDERWTKPVKLNQTGGKLGCQGAEATVAAVVSAPHMSAVHTRIAHHRCTPASCRSQVTTVEKMLKGEPALVPGSQLDVADLDGKLLVVWGAGERGGVRMRLAPAAEIGAAPDVVLYDNLLEGGRVQAVSTLRDLRVLSRPGFAVLLLSTKTGVHAIRIEPGGKTRQVRFAWSK